MTFKIENVGILILKCEYFWFLSSSKLNIFGLLTKHNISGSTVTVEDFSQYRLQRLRGTWAKSSTMDCPASSTSLLWPNPAELPSTTSTGSGLASQRMQPNSWSKCWSSPPLTTATYSWLDSQSLRLNRCSISRTLQRLCCRLVVPLLRTNKARSAKSQRLSTSVRTAESLYIFRKRLPSPDSLVQTSSLPRITWLPHHPATLSTSIIVLMNLGYPSLIAAMVRWVLENCFHLFIRTLSTVLFSFFWQMYI